MSTFVGLTDWQGLLQYTPGEHYTASGQVRTSHVHSGTTGVLRANCGQDMGL